MQYPINSLSTSKNIKKTQNTSSFVPTTSTCSLPMVFTGNTDEIPLTLSSSQTTSTNEYSIHSLAQVSTLLNVQSQYEYNQRNFWEVFHGNVTEDLFKEKILDYIKNNWGLNSSLKQHMNNPILKTRIDIQYQSLVDMLFQLKFIYFTNLIIIDTFNFIQTENQIKESGNIIDLELMIAKYDIKKEISEKLSFIFNTVYKNYLNRKNEILSQDALIRLIPLLTDELQQAERENLEFQIDSSLYAMTLPKIESLFTEVLNLDNKNPNENDEIDSIIQSSMLDMHSHSSVTTTLQEDISLNEQTFTQPTKSHDLISIADINEPQRSGIEARLKNADIRTINDINAEKSQKSGKSLNESRLKSFLVNIFEENIESYEQTLFKMCKENSPLKEKYLALTISALQTKKASQQIKTRIAQLIHSKPRTKFTTRSISKQKNLLYKNLADMLTNFSSYNQLMEELQPQKIQTKISIVEIKKTNKEMISTIQEIRKKLVKNKRKHNNILNQNHITKINIIKKISGYLTEQKAISIFKKEFVNLSANQIRKTISSTFNFYEDNITTENPSKTLQESIKADEALKLKFLLANIFSVPFYFEEQILFKAYKEEHPLKNKYLMFTTSALEATQACLKTKSRIAQLTHLKQKQNYDIRAAKMIETYLYKELTELFERASSYYHLMEELKPLGIQIKNKISAYKMKKINLDLVEQIRALQRKIICSQRYYNAILKDKQITENQVMQNIIHHLTPKEVIETIQKKFTNLSDKEIKEIIFSSEIIPQINDAKNAENASDISQARSEPEEIATLESLIVNIFKNPFYYNEQNLFDAYVQNIDSKEELLALHISAMQAKRACLKIKTRIIQLANLAQKENSRNSDVSAEKNFLYRDLTELFISSSEYHHLINKVQLSNIQPQKQEKEQVTTKKNAYLIRTKMREVATIDEDLTRLIRRKKKQLNTTQRYFHFTTENKKVTENQIIQNALLYLTEQKAIRTIKEKFTSLTEDKIKETITRSILLITENQAKGAEDTDSNEQLSQESQNDDWSENLAPAAKKMCIRESQSSASLSKALPESTAFQSTFQASALSFNSSQSETSTVREPKSTRIHFSSQSAELTTAQEEMKFAKASQTSTVSPNISSPLFFELFEQESLGEDLNITAIESTENE